MLVCNNQSEISITWRWCRSVCRPRTRVSWPPATWHKMTSPPALLQQLRLPRPHHDLSSSRSYQQTLQHCLAPLSCWNCACDDSWSRNNSHRSQSCRTLYTWTCQPIRDQYYYVSSNQRLVSLCFNQSENSIIMSRPIRDEHIYVSTNQGWG